MLLFVLSAKKLTTPESLFQSTQRLLEEALNHPKLRIVALWIDAIASSALINVVDQKWHGPEHWSLASGDRTSTEIRLLDGEDTPQVYLVDQKGRLVRTFTTKQ